jgi:hypothetical protein
VCFVAPHNFATIATSAASVAIGEILRMARFGQISRMT